MRHPHPAAARPPSPRLHEGEGLFLIQWGPEAPTPPGGSNKLSGTLPPNPPRAPLPPGAAPAPWMGHNAQPGRGKRDWAGAVVYEKPDGQFEAAAKTKNAGQALRTAPCPVFCFKGFRGERERTLFSKGSSRSSSALALPRVFCFKVFEEGSRGGTFSRKSLPRASPRVPYFTNRTTLRSLEAKVLSARSTT